jgi:precorrin-2 dehydrogenase/sirohydrochlorin ferrochelatase
MSRFYPVYLNVAGRLCVVIGGGAVAERKIAGLLEAGARVRVVSPEAAPGIIELAGRGTIEYHSTRYEHEYLKDAHLVFAATNARDVNAQVAAHARSLDIPVNVADAPDDGSFVVPSVVRRGEFCLSISTGGNNPMLAARLATEMQARFGPEFGAFVELLGDVRDTIKEWTSDTTVRRQAVAAVLDNEAELRAYLAMGHSDAARALALSIAQAIVGRSNPTMPAAETGIDSPED